MSKNWPDEETFSGIAVFVLVEHLQTWNGSSLQDNVVDGIPDY